ncbi:MAG: biopolymer transporter ExbD [Bdellovibrionales bacterium]
MASNRTAGNAKRLISTPGYHIHPQFDLKQLRLYLHNKKHKKKNFTLSLAPMVDMFSILVIYLLTNFSATGETFFIGKDIILPQSTKGAIMKNFPLISIVDKTVYFEMYDPTTKETRSYSEVNNESLQVLRQMLGYSKKVSQSINPNKPFEGQVNLQADQGAYAEDVKNVMRVLIEEGWSGINFIVAPNSK